MGPKVTKLFVLAVAVVCVLLRLSELPLENLSLLGALAVFCGARVRPVWLAVTAVLATRLVSDAALHWRTGYGFYGSMAFDYGAYLLVLLAGYWLQPQTVFRSLLAGVISAVLFFVVSNTGVWCMPLNGQYLYPQTAQGLLQCLINGLPFARGTLAGDILLTPLLFQVASLVLVSRPQSAGVGSEHAAS